MDLELSKDFVMGKNALDFVNFNIIEAISFITAEGRLCRDGFFLFGFFC